MPGPGCKFPGATATRNYEKWQEIFVNMDTLCENIADPDVSFELFGRKFAAPIFVAPLGAVDMHYGPKYNDQSYNAELMRAAVDCGITEGYWQETSSATDEMIPAFDGTGVDAPSV